MKTLRKEPIRLVRCEYFPPLDEIEEHVMYYSPFKGYSFHLCLCGCKEPIMLRIDDFCNSGWEIANEEKLTILGSIQRMEGCKSHYIITNGIANFV